jgi:hypothetical protein
MSDRYDLKPKRCHVGEEAHLNHAVQAGTGILRMNPTAFKKPCYSP